MIKNKTIIGAIAGDVLGSIYEWNNIKTTEFDLFNDNCKFTDDSVLTISITNSLLNNIPYKDSVLKYALNYPNKGYGGMFKEWIYNIDRKPYNSYGNGSAMRVSSIGFYYNTLHEVLEQAKQSAIITHNHIEGIKGAQAIASCIFLARTGSSKEEIKEYIERTFDYNLNQTIEEIRPTYIFNETCQGSVPQSIICFLESNDYESAIRLGIILGGDVDTICCMCGGIAIAYYKEIPKNIYDFVWNKLPDEFKEIITEFDYKYENIRTNL
jgi:ADP-ribosylglycohydrolase